MEWLTSTDDIRTDDKQNGELMDNLNTGTSILLLFLNILLCLLLLTMSTDTESTPMEPHVLLNLLCSRARVACKEATTMEWISGPENYYQIWLSRLKLEMVWIQSHSVSNWWISLNFQEVAEIFLGGSILRKKYHFVPPFFKSIHCLVQTTFQNIQQCRELCAKSNMHVRQPILPTSLMNT